MIFEKRSFRCDSNPRNIHSVIFFSDHKPSCVGGNSPADAAGVADFIGLGANFVTISAWGLLRMGAEDFRKRVQEELEKAA